MNPLQELAKLGQSIWQDDIRRDMLDDGTLERRIDEWALTGLTSNPSIFDSAIAGSDLYDDAIAALVDDGVTDPEQVFFALAVEDLGRAADVFAPVWERTGGTDGCVSLEVSPTLADDTEGSVEQAADLHERVGRPNLMVKIPGTSAGLPAITRSLADGISINVTLLFSVAQYEAQLDAWFEGLEQRQQAGESLAGVASVASIFVSRWDVAANEQLPSRLHNRLGIAMCASAYARYREMLASDRWTALEAAGATPQRLLFGSTSTKDPSLPKTMYVEALAAPGTVNTMPEETLEAMLESGTVGEPLPDDGGNATQAVAAVEAAGVDVDALGERLQVEGVGKFVDSWESLLGSLRDQIDRRG